MKLHSDILFCGLKGCLEYLNESTIIGKQFLIKVSDNRIFDGHSNKLMALVNILLAVNAIHFYVQQILAYVFILKKKETVLFVCV